MTINPITAAKCLIVKIGSALIVENGEPRQQWLKQLAADIARLKQQGIEVVLVSSGAVAIGRTSLRSSGTLRLNQKQAAAAIGQPRLMAAFADAFRPHGVEIGQALLTLSDTETRRRWLNARATLSTLLEAGILPIINENDSVATDEIRYGDNDRLAARVAQMMGADCLVLLSDVDGLYTADPRNDASAMHIAELDELTEEHDAMASGANMDAGVGSGGMATKLAAARIAHAAGCSTIISLGSRDHPLGAIEQGERFTLVRANTTPSRARRAWLAGHLTPEGSVRIDEGAVNALKGGASLLAVGVSGVSGRFERGAALGITAPDGTMIAKGVTAYSSDEIQRVIGRQSDEVEQILGYRGRPAIIHRDDMVLV